MKSKLFRLIAEVIAGIMKYLFLFLICSCCLTELFAQEPAFKNGDKVLNIGFGIGSDLYSRYHYKIGIPLVSASLEVGVKDGVIEKGSIGVGGYLGYTSYKEDIINFGYSYKSIIIGVRGSFHYPIVSKLDSYTGIMLGYNISSAKSFGSSSNNFDAKPGGLVFAWFVGGRYYFSNNFAGMAELGVGIVYLNLGVAFKF